MEISSLLISFCCYQPHFLKLRAQPYSFEKHLQTIILHECPVGRGPWAGSLDFYFSSEKGRNNHYSIEILFPYPTKRRYPKCFPPPCLLSGSGSFFGISQCTTMKNSGTGKRNSESSFRRDLKKNARKQATMVSKRSEYRKQLEALTYCCGL